jgi:hypothetical protein
MCACCEARAGYHAHQLASPSPTSKGRRTQALEGALAPLVASHLTRCDLILIATAVGIAAWPVFIYATNAAESNLNWLMAAFTT